MFNSRFFYLIFIILLLMVVACVPQVEVTPTTEPAIVPTATTLPPVTTAPTLIPSFTPTAVPTEVGSFPIGKFFAQNDPTSYFTFSKDGKWAHFAVGIQ